jgi:hypothetical protein
LFVRHLGLTSSVCLRSSFWYCFFLRLMKTIKRISPIPTIKSAIIPTTIPTTTEFQSKIQKQKLIEY